MADSRDPARVRTSLMNRPITDGRLLTRSTQDA